MKYKYIGNGDYIQGLGAVDLDDSKLSPEQKALLEQGVTKGLYKAEGAGKAPDAKKDKAGA